MGQIGKRRSAKDRLDPEEVLAGRVRVGAGDLLDLIHRVNPTGLDLPRRESDRRYVLKSRLQSLLIRCYREQLAIQADPQRTGFISISCERSGRNACHARLDALDEDARALVRRQLDQEDVRAPAPPRQRSEPGPKDDGPDTEPDMEIEEAQVLLEQGLEAQKEYDYEAARECFMQSLVASGFAPAPALALLTLLVDHLGADQDALQLLPELSAECLADTEVRLRLALAAARAGEDETSRQLLADLRSPQAAPVYLLLGRRALSAGDLQGCGAALEQARTLSPALADVLQLEADLLAARVTARRPEEEQLMRLLDEGDLAVAERRARELLQRWPESKAGGQVLRTVAERRQTEEAQALWLRAQAALKREDLHAAVRLLQQGLLTGVQGELRERLRARLAELEPQERALSEARSVAEVLDALAGTDDALAGLAAYAALPERLREQVRQRSGPYLPWLSWIDEMYRGRPDCPARAAAEAALALHRAHELCQHSPQAASHLVAEHQKLLEHVGAQRQLSRHIQQLLRERKQREARTQLWHLVDRPGAPSEFASAEEKLQHLGKIDLSVLTETERQEAARVRRVLQREVENRVLRARAMHLASDGNPVEAAALLDEVLAVDAGDRDDLVLLRKLCREVGRARLCVWIDPDPGADPGPNPGLDLGTETSDTCLLREAQKGVQHWISPCGRWLVLCQEVWGMIFVRVLGAESLRVTARATLHPPPPFRLRRHVVDADSVWLLDEQGGVIQLTLPDLEVRRRIGRQDAPGPGQVAYVPVLAPDSRALWLRYGNSPHGRKRNEDGGEVQIVDPRGQLETRWLHDRLWVRSIIGGGEDMMCCPGPEGHVMLHSRRGALLRQCHVDPRLCLRDATLHPSGRGLLLLATRWRPTDDGSEPPEDVPQGHDRVRIIGITDGGTVSHQHMFDDSDGEHFLAGATVPEQRRSFVTLFGPRIGGEAYVERQIQIVALHAPEERQEGLVEEYRADVPYKTTLIQGLAGGPVHALAIGPDGPELRVLSSSPPCFRQHAVTQAHFFGSPLLSLVCMSMLDCFKGETFVDVLRQLVPVSHEEHPRLMDEHFRRHADDPRRLMEMAFALDSVVSARSRAGYVDRIYELHKEDAWTRLWVAEYHARDGSFARVREILEGRGPGDLLPGHLRHYHHLLGLALLWTGDAKGALRVCRAGQAIAGPCQFEDLIHLCTSLPKGPLSELCDARQPLVRQLFAATRAADECLDRGDHLGAVRALDRPAVWHNDELQSLARLATAWLGLEPENGAEHFRKQLAMAHYLDAFMGANYGRVELPYPGRTWEDARLDRLKDQVVDWIGERVFGIHRQAMVDSQRKLAEELEQQVRAMASKYGIPTLRQCIDKGILSESWREDLDRLAGETAPEAGK